MRFTDIIEQIKTKEYIFFKTKTYKLENKDIGPQKVYEIQLETDIKRKVRKEKLLWGKRKI